MSKKNYGKHLAEVCDRHRELPPEQQRVQGREPAASTQPPSPQAEVQDCERWPERVELIARTTGPEEAFGVWYPVGAHDLSDYETRTYFRTGKQSPAEEFGGGEIGKPTGTRCDSCGAEERVGDEGWESREGLSWCPNCFTESPAELQGDVVRVLAKLLVEIRRDGGGEPSIFWPRPKAEEVIAAITPLLRTQIREEERHRHAGKIRQDEDSVRSNYALELRERLERLERYDCMGSREPHSQAMIEMPEGDWLERGPVLAALDRKDSDD